MNPHRIAGLGAIALGTGIAVSAVMGPLVLKVIKFRTSENLENQWIGGEMVSLAVVAPVAVAAGVLWLRDHRLAPALALGPALYAVYTYTTAAIGQEFARYPGNVERFFPLYAGLVAGGAALAAFAWSRLGQHDVPEPPAGLRRSLAGIFLGIGGLVALAWAQQIRLALTGTPSAEYQEGPTLFWLIKFLDFGFLIPLLLATGVGLLLRHPAAIKASYGLATFAACLAGSVAGMGIVMQVKGDPSAQPAILAVLLPATAGLASIAVRLLKTYTRGAGTVDPAIIDSLRRPPIGAVPA